MGNFGGLTAFYVRLLASRCMPAEPAPASGVPEAVIVQCPGCGEGVAEGMACRRRRGHVRPPDCKASPPREGDPDAYGVKGTPQ